MNNRGRAENKADRKEVINRILAVWERCPTLRLGQLIENATTNGNPEYLFFVEDQVLVEILEKYIKDID